MFKDRPCSTCGSLNHGTGAHAKLFELYERLERELLGELDQPLTEDERDGLEAELSDIRRGLDMLNRRPSELAG